MSSMELRVAEATSVSTLRKVLSTGIHITFQCQAFSQDGREHRCRAAGRAHHALGGVVLTMLLAPRAQHPTVAIGVAIYRMDNPARRKNPGKMGKKMENGPRPEMAKKWPPKWKNGHPNGILAIFFILAAIFWPFRVCGHFPFSFPVSRDFFVGQCFPFCKWLLRSQPHRACRDPAPTGTRGPLGIARKRSVLLMLRF